MNSDEFRRHARAMLCFIATVLEPERPPYKPPDDIDIDCLCLVAKRHGLSALTYLGVKKAGIQSESFREAAGQAKRTSVIQAGEYKALEAAFTENHIRHMPLKGLLLKPLYPGVGSREMSDIDVWYDRAGRDKVREIMLGRGYAPAEKQAPNHDVYRKPPRLIVEAHHDLFDGEVYPAFYEYYKNKSFSSSPDNEYLCRMSPSEMYVYLISHAYIHHISAGTGLRTLIDLRLYLRRFGAELDREEIDRELGSLGTAGFEAAARSLAMRMLDPDELTREESEMLDRFCLSGTHGTRSIYTRNRIDRGLRGARHGKLSYLRSRITVSDRHIKRSPFFSKHPNMVWMMRVARPFKILSKPKTVFRELKQLKDTEADSANKS